MTSLETLLFSLHFCSVKDGETTTTRRRDRRRDLLDLSGKVPSLGIASSMPDIGVPLVYRKPQYPATRRCRQRFVQHGAFISIATLREVYVQIAAVSSRPPPRTSVVARRLHPPLPPHLLDRRSQEALTRVRTSLRMQSLPSPLRCESL